MKKYNWVCQAITEFLCFTAIMFWMNIAPPIIPVLAGEYDLKGSIDAAKKAEAELRQSAEENRKKAQQAEYDAVMIIAKAYVAAYAKRGYEVTVEQVWERAIKYHEEKSGRKVSPKNRTP